MRSSLKKSLYLGLAALSFASVAGAAFENTTTASAKKTTKAKKHVKKTTKKAKKAAVKVTSAYNVDNQDQATTAVTLNSGVLTNKPGSLKGAHSVATGISSSEYFMVYRNATTSDGQKYYKVVSFTNHSHRGYVAANATTPISSTYTPTTSSSQNSNPVYLSNPGTTALYSKPAGSTFKPQVLVPGVKTGQFATDQFGITQTAKVNSTGETAYYVIDLSNTNVQGWVKASEVSDTATAYFDTSKDIKVNFTNNGSTVATAIIDAKDVPAANDYKYKNFTSNDGLLTDKFVYNLFSTNYDGSEATYKNPTSSNAYATTNLSSLLASTGSGYAMSQSDLDYSANQNPNDNNTYEGFANVKLGGTVNVSVHSIATENQNTSPLNFKSIAPNDQGQWNASDAKDISSDVSLPALDDTQTSAYKKAFSGNKNTFVNFDNAFTTNSLFGASGALNFFDGATQTGVTTLSMYTNGLNGVLAFNNTSDAKAAVQEYNNSDAKNQGVSLFAYTYKNDRAKLTVLPAGRAFHYAYAYDATATSQYNRAATLYGQTLTVVYDQVPVATNASATTASGYTGYIAK